MLCMPLVNKLDHVGADSPCVCSLLTDKTCRIMNFSCYLAPERQQTKYWWEVPLHE